MLLKISVENVGRVSWLGARAHIGECLLDPEFHVVVLPSHFEPDGQESDHLLHEDGVDKVGVLVEVTRLEDLLPAVLPSLLDRHCLNFTQ